MREMMRRSSAIQMSGLETELEHDRRYRAYLQELDRARAFTRRVRSVDSAAASRANDL